MSLIGWDSWYESQHGDGCTCDGCNPDVRPANELCEDSPVEGGKHVVDRSVSDNCVNCGREVES